MKPWLLAGLMVLGGPAVAAWAQETPDRAAEEEAAVSEQTGDEEAAPAPRRQIRVLHDPYQIASFYRARGGNLFSYDPRSEPYPIAGFYRNRQSTGYGPGYGAAYGPGYGPGYGGGFWSMGYGERDRRGLVLGFRRSIGEHGDLFLIAPTFLAPLGPLTNVFGR
jgi:hypothetical protein